MWLAHPNLKLSLTTATHGILSVNGEVPDSSHCSSHYLHIPTPHQGDQGRETTIVHYQLLVLLYRCVGAGRQEQMAMFLEQVTLGGLPSEARFLIAKHD